MSDEDFSDSTGLDRFALSFGQVASAYEKGRPSYPREAVEWLLGAPASGLAVLELGAGTGKLTETLVDLGADVLATDPDDGMLDVLSAKLPEVRATKGTAEQIPAPDTSFDLVVAGQAFHWFDLDVALPEIARVLREGAHLALVWNDYDTSIPWVRKLMRIVGERPTGPISDPSDSLVESGFFSATLEATFTHWQRIDRASLLDLVSSRSVVATKPEAERAQVLAEVAALYDEYGRGPEGMQLPYIARCFRTTVIARPAPPTPDPVAEPVAEPGTEPTVAVDRSSFSTGGDDTGTTLITFS